MSAPHDNHSDGKYPEDKVSHYPRDKSKKLKKMAQKTGGLYLKEGKGFDVKKSLDYKAFKYHQKKNK